MLGLAGAAADDSEGMVLLITKKNVEEEGSDRIETVTAAIMTRARARCGVEGKPTERMGWRAMRKTRSTNAVNLCEDLRIGRQHALARTGTEDNSGSCVVTWQWPLAACVFT